MYKYFTWKSGKYLKGQELLHTQQINALVEGCVDIRTTEAYSTIQDYDENGNIVRCPLYFDIDDSNLYDAYQTMTDLVNELRCVYDAEPYVWFSGSKGFHIILPMYIKSSRCHEIAKVLAKELTDGADNAVYRTRSMWRLNGSLNSKTGMFKVPVNPNQSLDHILNNAKVCNVYPIDYKILHCPDFEIKYKKVEASLPDINFATTVANNNSFNDMPNCLKMIWNMDIPPESSRHHICHLMSRFCFTCGMNTSETISIFKSHQFWASVNQRDYEKVIYSVYKSGKAHIGCKSGNDADLLQDYCNGLCVYQDDILDKIWPRK